MSVYRLKNAIREHKDFPKEGILFRDIFPLLADPGHFELAISAMCDPCHSTDAFVGIESRGFILAAAMAFNLSKGFIPLRKAGKLPPPIIKKTYNLEYGTGELEIAKGFGNVVIVDDVLATGGTMNAAFDLCKAAGYTVLGGIVLVGLKEHKDVKAVLSYE